MRTLLLLLIMVCVPATASAEGPSASDLLSEARGETTAPAKTPAPGEPKKTATPAPTKTADTPAVPEEPSEAPNPFGAATVLFLGAGIVALGAWGLQRLKASRDPFTANSMSHVQSMRLGPKHQVSIIDVDGQRFLIGLAEGAISLLSEVPGGQASPSDQPSRPAEAAENATKAEEPKQSWSAMFDEAREQLVESAGVDGQIIDFSALEEPCNDHRTNAYRKAGRSGKGNAPRARESDSVVVALKRLERSGETS